METMKVKAVRDGVTAFNPLFQISLTESYYDPCYYFHDSLHPGLVDVSAFQSY